MTRSQRGSTDTTGAPPAPEPAPEPPVAPPEPADAGAADAGAADAGAANAGLGVAWWRRPGGRLARAGIVAVLVAVAVAWFVHDDGTASDTRAGAGGPTTPPPSAQTLDQLAAAAGCAAKISAENTGYRQAVCQTPAARLVLTTFATDQGEQDWLSDAIPYGGTYLVGLRWVVNGSTPTGLPELAAKLGGTIVDKSQEHRHS